MSALVSERGFSAQAEGLLGVTFASAGTFSVSVAYVSTDPNFTGATVSQPLVVTVT
jgi:hypothetical protein